MCINNITKNFDRKWGDILYVQSEELDEIKITYSVKPLTNLEKEVCSLMNEKLNYASFPEDEWNLWYNTICNQYGKDKIDEEILSYQQTEWREIFRPVLYQVKNYQADVKIREEKLKELANKLKISEKIKKAKEEEEIKVVIKPASKFCFKSLCKHAEQCVNEKCKYVHPGDKDYENLLCSRIQKVLEGIIPLSIEWNCWHNQDGKTCQVQAKYGLCTDSHSEKECQLAKSDRKKAEEIKKASLKTNLEKLMNKSNKKPNCNIVKPKTKNNFAALCDSE